MNSPEDLDSSDPSYTSAPKKFAHTFVLITSISAIWKDTTELVLLQETGFPSRASPHVFSWLPDQELGINLSITPLWISSTVDVEYIWVWIFRVPGRLGQIISLDREEFINLEALKVKVLTHDKTSSR